MIFRAWRKAGSVWDFFKNMVMRSTIGWGRRALTPPEINLLDYLRLSLHRHPPTRRLCLMLDGLHRSVQRGANRFMAAISFAYVDSARSRRYLGSEDP